MLIHLEHWLATKWFDTRGFSGLGYQKPIYTCKEEHHVGCLLWPSPQCWVLWSVNCPRSLSYPFRPKQGKEKGEAAGTTDETLTSINHGDALPWWPSCMGSLRSRLREQTRRARVSTGPNPIRRESSRMNRDKERGETKGAGRPAGILLQKCSGHRSLSGKGFSGGADIGGGDSEVGLRFSLSAFYARTCCSSCLLA